MAITNLAVAEEALALAPGERADLAKLLVQSLEGDPRTDEAITADLTPRLEDLVSGKDSGLNFEQVFGSDQSLASTPPSGSRDRTHQTVSVQTRKYFATAWARDCTWSFW